jgi:hypothetical protein
MNQQQGGPPGDAGLTGALTGMVFLVVVAVLAVAVLAWSPWSQDEAVAPGQGGADTPVPLTTMTTGTPRMTTGTPLGAGTPMPTITPVLPR